MDAAGDAPGARWWRPESGWQEDELRVAKARAKELRRKGVSRLAVSQRLGVPLEVVSNWSRRLDRG